MYGAIWLGAQHRDRGNAVKFCAEAAVFDDDGTAFGQISTEAHRNGRFGDVACCTKIQRGRIFPRFGLDAGAGK